MKNFLLIDLNTSEIIKTMPMTLGFGFVNKFLSENLIVSQRSRKGLLGLFTLDNEEVWQLNINTLFATEDQSEIKQIKIYNESLIIASNEGIASIEINTGKVNWVTETYAITIEIVDNIGYACTSASLYKINLDTGIISGYGWEYHALPEMIYNEKEYTPAGHEVIYHDGLLWYTVYSQGASFIIAINPHDGYYEWVHYVEGSDKINSIKFYQNRMYVLDIQGVLHVYEKEQ